MGNEVKSFSLESNKENEEPGKRKRSKERNCARKYLTSPESHHHKKIKKKKRIQREIGNRLDSPKAGKSVKSPKARPSVPSRKARPSKSPTQPLSMETTRQPSSKGKGCSVAS